MGDYHSERYRRDTPWRADESRRNDDLGDPWDDDRGSRWLDSDDWQPESYGDEWDDAQRRQRLTPGQLSEGGPAPGGYRREHDDDRGNGWQRSQREQRTGSDLRYGLNGGDDASSDRDEDWRVREQYRSRQYASEYGDYGDLGGYRRGAQQSRNAGRDGGQGFGNADQAWLRSAAQREPRHSGHNAYFNDLRSDTRYWTEPRDEWGESRPHYAQSYGRDYLGGRGYDEELGYSPRYGQSARTERWRDDRDDRDEDHGMLYNIGHRIGQAMSEWFGSDSDSHERRSGPRGYTRTDERIRDEICERLTFTSGVDVRDVTVEVEKGKVTLGGTVRMRSQKYDIEDMVDNTFGVTDVENNIRVQRQDVDAAAKDAGGFNGW